MEFISGLLALTITMATPFLLCVIGGVFSDRSGVVNFTYEGIMSFGAFGAIVFAKLTNNILIGCVMGVLISIVVELIFGFFVLNLKGNATFVGLAMNLIASAIIPFLMSVVFNRGASLTAYEVIDPVKMILHFDILDKIPFIGPILNNHTLLTYLTYPLIAIMTVILYKTKFGMYVRVTGESPEAAEALGIKTRKMKYLALVIAAFFCGLAGINLSVETLAMYTNNMIAGRGFICLSAIMCGRGKPIRSSLFAMLFGLAHALQIRIASYVAPATATLIGTLPYIAMIVTLVIAEYPLVKKDPERIERKN